MGTHNHPEKPSQMPHVQHLTLFLLPLARPHSTGNLRADALTNQDRAIYTQILHFSPKQLLAWALFTSSGHKSFCCAPRLELVSSWLRAQQRGVFLLSAASLKYQIRGEIINHSKTKVKPALHPWLPVLQHLAMSRLGRAWGVHTMPSKIHHRNGHKGSACPMDTGTPAEAALSNL